MATPTVSTNFIEILVEKIPALAVAAVALYFLGNLQYQAQTHRQVQIEQYREAATNTNTTLLDLLEEQKKVTLTLTANLAACYALTNAELEGTNNKLNPKEYYEWSTPQSQQNKNQVLPESPVRIRTADQGTTESQKAIKNVMKRIRKSRNRETTEQSEVGIGVLREKSWVKPQYAVRM